MSSLNILNLGHKVLIIQGLAELFLFQSFHTKLNAVLFDFVDVLD